MWSSLQAVFAFISGRVGDITKDVDGPTVSVKNGTYKGLHSSFYGQDFFLGIPYAQPPVGNLRFRAPQSLNATWSGVRSAQEHSSECYGYSSDQWNYHVSEDCLYLDIVRPAGYENALLPVAFWIHGGGFVAGGGIDQRYNTSFMIKNSVAIGKPIMTVSINYRLSTWGFLNSQEIRNSGNTNLGLRDQRLALEWVKENIASFGGDHAKVTIWGESAGASSVGFHLTAYNGRDDKLFRGAIMESGGPTTFGEQRDVERYQPMYNLLSELAGCSNSSNSLQCLRTIPAETLNSIINGTNAANGTSLRFFGPEIDGDFIGKQIPLQLKNGNFVHVPIISGANSDEGVGFSPIGINTEEDFYNSLTKPTRPLPARPISASLAKALIKAYPDDPSTQGIASLPPTFRFGPPFGAHYRRAVSYFGDAAFVAGRRKVCQSFADVGVDAYCYRFNAIPAGVSPIPAVTHFQEIAFVFYNTDGVGYPPVNINPFTNRTEAYTTLAKFMDSSWISFVSDLDPNAWRSQWNGNEALWLKYNVTKPTNYVFDANQTSYVEDDVYRAEGMRLIVEGHGRTSL